MFILTHKSRNDKEVFEFDTEEEINAKLEEIKNLYPINKYRRYYKNGVLESIDITTDQTAMTFYLD